MAMFKLQTLLIPEALPVQAPMMTTRPMIRISRTVAIALSFTVKSLFLIVSTINSSCDPLTSGHIVNCPSFHNLCDFFSQVYTSSFAIYAASLGRLRVLEHIALHCIAGPVCKARQDRQTDRHNWSSKQAHDCMEPYSSLPESNYKSAQFISSSNPPKNKQQQTHKVVEVDNKSVQDWHNLDWAFRVLKSLGEGRGKSWRQKRVKTVSLLWFTSLGSSQRNQWGTTWISHGWSRYQVTGS